MAARADHWWPWVVEEESQGFGCFGKREREKNMFSLADERIYNLHLAKRNSTFVAEREISH